MKLLLNQNGTYQDMASIENDSLLLEHQTVVASIFSDL
jgi:hypothetical protein